MTDITKNRLADEQVIAWLLDSDSAICWQVLQDVLGAPAEQVAAERARVASQGWGAELLALQADDGTWGGAAWNRGWDSTVHVLMLLRDFGLDPDSDQAQRALSLVREQVTWQGDEGWHGNPFFAGEVEPCINGQVAAAGACFGQDVGAIIARLLGEQLEDGGWNCDAPNDSIRSSFNTTICVLEALLAYEQRFGASPALTSARLCGQEYLLERRLFRRRSTGEVITQDRKGGIAWTSLAFPTWWHYVVLRGLEYLRQAGVTPDERAAEAVDLLRSKRRDNGRWLLELQSPAGWRSRWVKPSASRAAGSRCAPCVCWTGIQERPEPVPLRGRCEGLQIVFINSTRMENTGGQRHG